MHTDVGLLHVDLDILGHQIEKSGLQIPVSHFSAERTRLEGVLCTLFMQE